MASSLRRQLEYISRRYQPMAESDVAEFFAVGMPGRAQGPRAGHEKKPGIIISFDDGLRDHYRVAAPLLEEFGFRGWFFVPAALPRIPVPEQRSFCEANGLHLPADSGDRIGMDCEELLDLNRRGHVIGCHTMNHRRFCGAVDPDLINVEIRDARSLLGSILGKAPTSFAWVGGESETYHPQVQKALKKEGFFFAFTTMSMKILPNANPLMLHRTVLDADMAFPLFLAKIGGLSDLSHLGRRRALEARLSNQKRLKDKDLSIEDTI